MAAEAEAPAAPSGFAATTNPAISVTADAAILTGLVNPYGLTATAYFQWGLTTSYGSTTTAQTVISGTGNTAISATLNGLALNTVYNFRMAATNTDGATYGVNRSFTTLATNPWQVEVIDTNASGGFLPSSVAVDSNNKVHISFTRYPSFDLMYATNLTGSWVITPVDTTGIVNSCSIAIDSNNKVHISYADGSNSAIKYATNK